MTTIPVGRWCSRVVLQLGVSLLGLGCGSKGTIVGPRPDPSFVTDQSTVFMTTAAGIERVSLDGRRRHVIFKQRYEVLDVTADYATFVFHDSDTNLYIGDAKTGTLREVAPLHGRAAHAAISPDGRTIAVTRHADFSLPQQAWVDDDAIHLVDVASLGVRTLPAASKRDPTQVAWSEDGTRVLVRFEPLQSGEWVSIATGSRTEASWSAKRGASRVGSGGVGGGAPDDDATLDKASARQPGVFRGPLRSSPQCEGQIVYDTWDTSIRVTRDGRTDTVVRETGRSRGFHDYRPDFFEPRWSPDCAHLVFGYGRDTWVAAVATGAVAKLGAGSLVVFGPPFDRDAPDAPRGLHP